MTRQSRIGVVLTALSAALCAVAIEGALRIGWIPNPKHEIVAMERRWRDAERRVLILGDSFIVSHGGLAPLLDRELAERGIAVWNIAVSGTGPFEYLERLRSFDRAAPDVVLLGYYVGNDLTDVRDNPKYDPNASGTAIRLDAPPLDPLPNLKWHHRLYASHWLRPLLTPAPPVRAFDWSAFAQAGIDPELIEDARKRAVNPYLLELSLRNPNHLLDNILMEAPSTLLAWNRVTQLLDEIHDTSRQRGAKLLIVVFPRSIQVSDAHFAFFEKLKFVTDPRTLATARPQERMLDYAASRSIPLLDLLPRFRQHAGQWLYLKKDDHLNRAGNGLSAQLIVPWLTEQFE